MTLINVIWKLLLSKLHIERFDCSGVLNRRVPRHFSRKELNANVFCHISHLPIYVGFCSSCLKVCWNKVYGTAFTSSSQFTIVIKITYKLSFYITIVCHRSCSLGCCINQLRHSFRTPLLPPLCSKTATCIRKIQWSTNKIHSCGIISDQYCYFQRGQE